MADQKFVVGYWAGDTSNYLVVEASSVTQYGEDKESLCWKIAGEKGTLWMSASAFLYAYPAEMMLPK
jgi:hypothetical protein